MLILQAVPACVRSPNVSPAEYYNLVTPDSVPFAIELTVPAGVEHGIYQFVVSVVGDGLSYGDHQITINVPAMVSEEVSDTTISSFGKVTGGGFLLDESETLKHNFGFTVHYDSNGHATMKGQLQFVDRDNNIHFHGNELRSLLVEGNKAVFTGAGLYQGNEGFLYEVEVLDNGNFVVFTDGADNHSLTTISELIPLIKERDIVIYSIGLGDVEEENLQTLSVNGHMVLAESADDLVATFDTIADYIKSIYTVMFWTPSRSGIHELEFYVKNEIAKSNTISTLFQASETTFNAIPNGIISPTMQVTVSGTRVSVSWNNVEGADGYILYYTPPDISYVHTVDMGMNTSIEVDLWHGFDYLVAVQPYNVKKDIGGLSNIVDVEIP